MGHLRVFTRRGPGREGLGMAHPEKAVSASSPRRKRRPARCPLRQKVRVAWPPRPQS